MHSRPPLQGRLGQTTPPIQQKIKQSSQYPLLWQQPLAHVVLLHGWQAPPAHPLGQNEVVEPYVQLPPEHVPVDE